MTYAQIAVALCALFTSGVGGAAGPSPQQRQEAIWKSPPPPKTSQAEFGAQDPYGLSIGVPIAVDCSIYWVSPDTRKLYCFNSLTSKSFFMDNPKQYISGARAFLAGDKQQDEDQSGAGAR